MIEKFSAEELREIMKDLGIPKPKQKGIICAKEHKWFRNYVLKKVDSTGTKANTITCRIETDNCIFKIIDLALSNFEIKTREYNGEEYTETRFARHIPQELEDEYKEMYREIIDIIKKHDRPWEG